MRQHRRFCQILRLFRLFLLSEIEFPECHVPHSEERSQALLARLSAYEYYRLTWGTPISLPTGARALVIFLGRSILREFKPLHLFCSFGFIHELHFPAD